MVQPIAFSCLPTSNQVQKSVRLYGVSPALVNAIYKREDLERLMYKIAVEVLKHLA